MKVNVSSRIVRLDFTLQKEIGKHIKTEPLPFLIVEHPCFAFWILSFGTDKQELEVELLFIKGRIYSNPYIYPLVFICLTDLRVVAWSQGIKGPA